MIKRGGVHKGDAVSGVELAMKYGERERGLILVSPVCKAPSWTEWLYNKNQIWLHSLHSPSLRLGVNTTVSCHCPVQHCPVTVVPRESQPQHCPVQSMLLPSAYVTVLGFLGEEYLIERKILMPYTATLIGFYRKDEDENLQLGRTVEKPLRRRGIGWHLLKASAVLISQMNASREVYLHGRMIYTAPLSIYAKIRTYLATVGPSNDDAQHEYMG
ncbi:hypothetical protein ACSBR1_029600 [Camellia fascicularis]